VVAFRRVYVAAEGDRTLERFILEAASLRHRVSTDASEISEILDETMVTREAPVFDRARKTTVIAEGYVNRFGEHLGTAVGRGAYEEAQELQLLRMRLLRDYAGLWLLVHRPTG